MLLKRESLNVRVTVDEPVDVLVEVAVTVQFGAVPVITKLPLLTIEELLELGTTDPAQVTSLLLLLIVNIELVVWVAPMLKVTWLGIAEITGAAATCMVGAGVDVIAAAAIVPVIVVAVPAPVAVKVAV